MKNIKQLQNGDPDTGSGAIEPSSNLSPTGKVQKKSGKRIGYNYIIVKSLKESQKNDVVKCLYIKSLTNFGFCVIKEGTYGDTKDKHGRDIKDRLMWQQQLHEALQDKVPVPRLFGHFQENGNYYLVIENIKGKPLYKAIRAKSRELRDGLAKGSKTGIDFLNYALQIVNVLDTLHKQNIVHRDATANNFIITPNGKIALIDLELSYSLDQQLPSPPFQLGTHGYMSPEQLKTAIPTIKEDVFAAGAVLFHVWTGISPSKLTDGSEEQLINKINFFIPDTEIASIIQQCLNSAPEKRPSLKTVSDALEQYKNDLQDGNRRTVNKPICFSHKQINETVQQAISTLTTPLMVDKENGWFAEDMKAESNKDNNKLSKAWYASFNRGATGVMYFLSQAKSAGFEVNNTFPFVEKALLLIETKYINRIHQVSPNLHFGAAGIAASLALSIQNGLVEPQTEYMRWIDPLLNIENNSLGFTHGIAGQGMANLLCQDFLQSDILQQRLQQYVAYLLQSQGKDGAWNFPDEKHKQRIRQGFATGISGIIYFLLHYGQIYQDVSALESAGRGLGWLIKQSRKNGNAIFWHNSKNKELVHWWSEGTSGIALAFLKAYECLADPRYKRYAIGALFNNPKQIIDNNLSQYAGLSGLGEIYLEAYRILNESEWMERANWITQVIMHLKKEHPEHGPYWLVNHERHPTPDFMIGNSGIMHFLLRCGHHANIPFPLLGGN